MSDSTKDSDSIVAYNGQKATPGDNGSTLFISYPIATHGPIQSQSIVVQLGMTQNQYLHPHVQQDAQDHAGTLIYKVFVMRISITMIICIGAKS